MARPKAADPRSQRIVVRVTPGEFATVRLRAETAGMTVSDYVRAVVDTTPSIRDEVEAARREVVDVPPPPRLQCPVCTFRAASPKARCPVHGRTVVAR